LLPKDYVWGKLMKQKYSSASRINIHCGRKIQVGKAPYRALAAMLRTRTVGEYLATFDAELVNDPIPGNDTAEGIMLWLNDKAKMITFE
jgi:hypothetical protein